jgi:hypothetical protein
VVFIRGPQPESVIWRHFRGEGDGFSFGVREGVYEAVVVANADRAVELYLALAEHLSPAVRLEIDDVRSGVRWSGDDLALPDVRDAVARLKPSLSTFAGAEITIVSDEDQLTLTPNLDVFVYARTDRWLYLLQGKGVRRVRHLRPRSWRLARSEFAPAPEATQSLRLAAERLGIADTLQGPSDGGDGGRA